MTPGAARAEPSGFGEWLRRQGALLALLRDNTFRRNLLAILVLNLRRLLGWRFAAALVLLPAAAAWLAHRYGTGSAESYDIIQGLLALAALGSASTFYSSEQQAGTFELLWLSTGSERSMLRFRAAAESTMTLLLALPCVLAVKAFGPAEGVRPALAIFLVVTNGWFLFAAMAWLGTWFSQAWAAGLLGMAVFAAWFFAFRGSASLLYPFPNPFADPLPAGSLPGPPVAGVAIMPNRIFFLGLSALLLRGAARRLRSVF